MSELIVIQPQQIGNEEVNSVDARELHENLGVKKKFSDWIKYNIQKLNMSEGIDFATVPKIGTGGKFDSLDYIVALDAAKHIAMMAGTSKAHEVRTYFIEFEKKAKASLPTFNDPIIMLRMEQLSMQKQIADVSTRVDSIVPAHTASTLNTMQGAVSAAAKWYRAISNAKHIPIRQNEAQAHVTAILLDREGVSDIGYIKNAAAALNYLRKLTSHYKGEYDAFIERNSLFARA